MKKLGTLLVFLVVLGVSGIWAREKEKAHIKSISEDGSVVKLDNGEKYIIDEKYRRDATIWRVGQLVEIDDHSPYCKDTELTYMGNRSSVCAK